MLRRAIVECRAIVLYYNLYFITTEWRGGRSYGCAVGGSSDGDARELYGGYGRVTGMGDG